jgi:hypothetical protein
MRCIPRLRVVRATLVSAVAVAGATQLTGQIPEEFHNLQVLPEDISRPELIATMRGFALGLGVRCHHCHVGEEAIPFSEYDFESDEKETKRKARFMLQMVQDLNNDRLPGLTEIGQRAEPGVEVTCEMCHRGRPVPWMLEEVLAATIDTEGADAAVAQYRTLRDEFYGSGSYGFGPMTLVDVAGQLAERQQTDAALADVGGPRAGARGT